MFQEALPWFFPALVFLLGACWGSFLNVVIYRLPAGQSLVRPGSHCACGAPIRPWDNIPILSWLLLRGRARCCGRRFSFRYPAIELFTALCFLGCWLSHAPPKALAGFVFLSILICAAFIDLDTMLLPDVFTIGGAVAGVLLAFLVPSLHGQADAGIWLVDGLRSGIIAGIGLLIGSATVLWIMVLAETFLKREAMGFGDVVFMGCIGAFCGWQGAVFSIFGGALIGTVMVLPLALYEKITGKRIAGGMTPRGEPASAPDGKEVPAASTANPQLPAHADTAARAGPPPAPNAGTGDDAAPDAGGEPPPGPTAIPFGPWLAAGAALYFVLAEDAVDGYFAEFARIIFSPLN